MTPFSVAGILTFLLLQILFLLLSLPLCVRAPYIRSLPELRPAALEPMGPQLVNSISVAIAPRSAIVRRYLRRQSAGLLFMYDFICNTSHQTRDANTSLSLISLVPRLS